MSGLAVYFGHVGDEVEHLVGVADLVVVPADNLHELVGQVHAGVGVEDAGQGASQEVGAYHGVLGVAEHTLELALAGGLHGGADLLLGGRFFQVHRQVDHADVDGGYAHGDAGELAVELGDDLADGLGSARGGGNDVVVDRTACAPVTAALKRQKLAFDYALTSEVPLLPDRVHLSYEARIAIIEGDEHVTSALEKRFQLEFYRPHIAILTNLMWTSATDHATPEAYHTTFRTFASSIERGGKLIYFDGDPVVKQLAQEVREDITAMPYDQHVVVEKEGKTYLQTRYGDFPVYIPDRFFLINLNAARLACRQLGVKDADFYQALSEYSVSLQP